MKYAMESKVNVEKAKMELDASIQSRQLTALKAQNTELLQLNTELKQEFAGLNHEGKETFQFFQVQHDRQQKRLEQLSNEVELKKKAFSEMESDAAEYRKISHEEIAKLKSQIQFLDCLRREWERAKCSEADAQGHLAMFLSDPILFPAYKFIPSSDSDTQGTELIPERTTALFESVSSATNRTLIENKYAMSELAYQSKQIEALLSEIKGLQMENQKLRNQINVSHMNEVEYSKRLYFTQKIISQLQSVSHVSPMKEEAKTLQCMAQLESNCIAVVEYCTQLTITNKKLNEERQDWLAQQDEIVSFLCRALQLYKERQKLETGQLDELSNTETLNVMEYLIDQMRQYQTNIASLYRNRAPYESTRHDLERHLGMKLPQLSSPEKNIERNVKIKCSPPLSILQKAKSPAYSPKKAGAELIMRGYPRNGKAAPSFS